MSHAHLPLDDRTHRRPPRLRGGECEVHPQFTNHEQGSGRHGSILQTQRILGNRVVQRMLARSIQRDWWDDVKDVGSGAANSVGGLIGSAGSALPRVSGDIHLGSDGLDVSGTLSAGGNTVGGSMSANSGGVSATGAGTVGGSRFSGEGSVDSSGHGSAQGSYRGSDVTLAGSVSDQGIGLSGTAALPSGAKLAGSGEWDRGSGASGTVSGSQPDGSSWSLSGAGSSTDPRTWSGKGQYEDRHGSVSGQASGDGSVSATGQYHTQSGTDLSGSAALSGGSFQGHGDVSTAGGDHASASGSYSGGDFSGAGEYQSAGGSASGSVSRTDGELDWDLNAHR